MNNLTLSTKVITMSKFVVSANYRNRNSQYKWLVRRIDEPIDRAVACEDVQCIGVKFTESNADEKGFGCGVVAVCENVSIGYPETETDLPAGEIPNNHAGDTYSKFMFNGYAICRTVPVESVERINLHYDGSMSGWGKSVDIGQQQTVTDPHPSPFQTPNTSVSSGMGIPKH